MEKLNTVVLSLGSNIEDRLDYLRKAIDAISTSIGKPSKISPIYSSEAIGFHSPIDFLNLCLIVRTPLSARDLVKKTQSIEQKLGRIAKMPREMSYSSREIDIDIIAFNDEIIVIPDLIIPHPRYSERKFVLLPLHDIFPEFIDPTTGQSIEKKIDLCSDNSKIIRTALFI